MASRRFKGRLERQSRGRDSSGGSTTTWTLRRTIWFSLEPQTGREQIQDAQMTSNLTHVVGMRYGDISVGDRIVFGSRTLTIAAYRDPTGKKDDLLVDVTEVQA